MAPDAQQPQRSPASVRESALHGFYDKDGECMPIPTKFVQQYLAPEHGRRATLTSPMGKFWHVDVARGDGDGGDDAGCFFAGGWAEFVKDNALAPENFLVFRYEGNMVFTVKVFDTSGCCIEDGGAAVAASGDALSIEPNAPRRQADDGTGCQSQHTGKIQDDGTGNTDTARKISKRKLATDDDNINKKQKAHSNIIPTEANEKHDYKDTLPIYVKAVSPCNFRYSYMNIGKKFCSMNDLLSNRLMTLKDQDGQSWPVKLTLTADHARMKAGWRPFSSHHGIKVGDRCVFQLIDPHNFSVSIRRAT